MFVKSVPDPKHLVMNFLKLLGKLEYVLGIKPFIVFGMFVILKYKEPVCLIRAGNKEK